MEEEELDCVPEAILLKSLHNSGIPLSQGVSSIQTPGTFFSLCARSLSRIDPSFLPQIDLDFNFMDISMPQQLSISTQMSDAFYNLGYTGPKLAFHQFLYPSEEELHNMLRFLVERLSDTSPKANVGDISSVNEATSGLVRGESQMTHPLSDLIECTESSITSKLKRLTMNTDQLPLQQSVAAEYVSINRLPFEDHKLDKCTGSVHLSNSRSRSLESTKDDEPQEVNSAPDEELENSAMHGSGNKEPMFLTQDSALDDNLNSSQAQSSKMRNEKGSLQSQGEMLKQELATKALEAQHLESKHDLLKAAVQMAFDDQHPVEFHITELSKQVEAKKENLQQLELHWDASIKPLEEKKRSLQELLHAQKPEVQLNVQKMEEIELETEAIVLEVQKREVERSKLSSELEKQPKAAARKSYIQRIYEITKNSRKQDADIERILKDTRDLQLESNSIRERLHRTYAVADETIFREAKKDPVRQQAYRLLTTIHENFGQISEKILSTDKIRREVVELEAKLAAIPTRDLNNDKLQADLDAMRKENEQLEKQLHRNSITQEVTSPDDGVD